MDLLATDALAWALTHVNKYGDTDIFPVPFEYKCIVNQSTRVIDHLRSVDLEVHETSPTFRLLMPKPGFGFRVATQLDPYDCLLYLAMIHEAANPIESPRVEESQRVACSYRVDITADGTLFRKHDGWPDFRERSQDLASRPDINFVVTADISDFYNQIYHHRVQGALEAAGVDATRSHSTERFLGGFTAKQSRGIPVGPFGSILLAEACLADVDSFLIRKGYEHARYVDDFRIFLPDQRTAIQALHDLTEFLYSVHRLSIQGAKTHLYTAARFTERELIDPEESELNRRRHRLNELLEDIDISSFYSEAEEIEITPEMENQAVRDALLAMFREVVRAKPIQLGFARHLLRRARLLRTRVFLEELLDNLENLMPVLRDVIMYLLAVYPRNSPSAVGSALVGLVERSDFRDLTFVQTWVLHALSTVPGFCSSNQALGIAEKSRPEIRERYGALIARAHKVVDWVRERKETWPNTAPWSQRAIIWAGSILPRNERRHWLKPIKESSNHLNAVVAMAADQL